MLMVPHLPGVGGGGVEDSVLMVAHPPGVGGGGEDSVLMESHPPGVELEGGGGTGQCVEDVSLTWGGVGGGE